MTTNTDSEFKELKDEVANLGKQMVAIQQTVTQQMAETQRSLIKQIAENNKR